MKATKLRHNNIGTDEELIRQSTPRDLDAIKLWLKRENALGIEGNFLCNWEIIRDSHERGDLLVYTGEFDGIPLGFQLGGLLQPGILQVKHDWRGRGIGRKLVEHRKNQARKAAEPFLFIECEPPSSIPFWKKMGFTVFENQRGTLCGYQILQKKHQLPFDGKATEVTIRFFSEARKWNKTTTSFGTFTPRAVQQADGPIYLKERVSIFKDIHPDARDIVVEIEIEGEQKYCDKAKYPGARKLGVRQRSRGFFIDRVDPL